MQIRERFLPVVICYTLVVVATSAAQEHHPGHSWDYGESNGPSHWGELKPEFALCKDGHHQSPIDIRNPKKADLPGIQFDYKPSPLHIIDNGHTVMINYGPGSFMSVGGEKYALKQFHFHRPSEEKINGEGYEMVVHLVHANQEGKLAVVAVLLQRGEDNPLVRELWKTCPRKRKRKKPWTVSGLMYPDYCRLSQRTPPEISQGAEDGSEMGVFQHLYQPQRETNLRLVLEEYLRFGLEAGVLYVT